LSSSLLVITRMQRSVSGMPRVRTGRVGALAALLAALPLAISHGRAAQGTPPLVPERTIALAGVSGRIDHMAFDTRRSRLLVAEIGNGSLDVIDITTARPVVRITGLAEPQGVAYAPSADAIVVACGGDGQIRLFSAADFASLGAIALGDDADDVAPVPGSAAVAVGFGQGGLALIDPARRAVAATVTLPAHPEAFRIDAGGVRAFVNLPDAHQIAVVDLGARRQIAAWTVPGLHGNFPMVLDPDDATLAVVFRSPPALVLLRVADGAVIARQPACSDADDAFFDAKRLVFYVSCGAGSVDVFRRDRASLSRIARIATAPGARTSLFVPGIDRLFVAAPAPLPGAAPARILVLRPLP
jgi:hypothetical protein